MNKLTQAKKAIIDTDMGWDDVLSILYLMKDPNIEIIGICVTGCGETNLRWGTLLAKTLLELGHQTQACVAVGCDTPLQFNNAFPQPFKNDMNDLMGLLGTLNPDMEIPVDHRPAWTFIADMLAQTAEPISIISLGGFTNLAKLLTVHPDAKTENIKEIFAMAGAIHIDGNISAFNNAKPEWDQGATYRSNHVAEWNVFVDPLAAKQVFDSNLPLTLVPLDACYYVILNPDFSSLITATDPIAELTKNILDKKSGPHDEGIPVPIFDPLATMLMAGGLTQYQVYQAFLDVDLCNTMDNNQCGNTFITGKGSRKIDIIQGVSQHAFSEMFAKIING